MAPLSYSAIPDGSSPAPAPASWPKLLCLLPLAAVAVPLFAMLPSSSSASLATTLSSPLDSLCTGGHYSKTTLKEAATYPFIALFPDAKGAKKFEGSDVIYDSGYFYAIADSLWSILSVDSSLKLYESSNSMIGDPFREEDESGYEAIFKVDDIFYVVRESIADVDSAGDYHAIVEELAITPDGTDYEIVAQCPSEFSFAGDSKGFEGAVGLKSADGTLYMLGLCEGNHCAEGKRGKDKGNGKVVVLKKAVGDEGCSWEPVRTMDIPKSANFQDYSAISVSDAGKVAITSQEESAVWIGHLGGYEGGELDVDAAEFVDEKSKVLNFPRDGECRMIFCNIEGIHWIGDDQLVAVSDKMKNRGKQDFRCFDKDQSLHVFAMP